MWARFQGVQLGDCSSYSTRRNPRTAVSIAPYHFAAGGAQMPLSAPSSLTSPQDPPAEAKVSHLSANCPRPGMDSKDLGFTPVRMTDPSWSQWLLAHLVALSLSSDSSARLPSTCSFKVRRATGLVSPGLEPLYVAATILTKTNCSWLTLLILVLLIHSGLFLKNSSHFKG